MKDKEKIIPLVVFVLTFIIVIVIFTVFSNSKKQVYSCYDYENDKTYTFETEEEMHQVCDKLDGVEEDKLLSSNPIYEDLIATNDSDFAFYPYINDEQELVITIAISNCDTPDLAKKKAVDWFSEHSYDINDYIIEYEYPCIN